MNETAQQTNQEKGTDREVVIPSDSPCGEDIFGKLPPFGFDPDSPECEMCPVAEACKGEQDILREVEAERIEAERIAEEQRKQRSKRTRARIYLEILTDPDHVEGIAKKDLVREMWERYGSSEAEAKFQVDMFTRLLLTFGFAETTEGKRIKLSVVPPAINQDDIG